MFGYIRICKPQMKICDYEIYQSVYCTLCRYLGHSIGVPARMLLSYDYTFIALLSMALSEHSSCFVRGRCVFNPAKRCGKCIDHDEIFKYTSALTAIMFYHKLRDNVEDSSGLNRALWTMLMPYASRIRKKAAKQYAEEDEWADLYIKNQFEIEQRMIKNGDINIDELCEPTADIISSIAMKLSEKSDDKLILHKFGYFLGRWIYMIDALDDLNDDVLNGEFNPIALKFSLTADDVQNKTDIYENARCFGNDSLNMSISEAIKYYELLELGDFKPILDNIIYQGMSQAQQSALYKNSKENKKRIYKKELNGR